MIERTSLKQINLLLAKNTNWNILDIGCGYTAHDRANVVADVQDFADFYKEKKNLFKLKKKNFHLRIRNLTS